MAIGRIPEPGTGIPESIIAAKGDILTGTANDTPAVLTAGTNETRLVADSGEATGLKYVADTTNYAVAAKGDLLVGTAADTVAPLTVGTDGYTLVADSSTATGLAYAAPAAGGKLFQIVQGTTTTQTILSTTVYTDTTITATITPTSATSQILVMVSGTIRTRAGSTTITAAGKTRLMRGATEVQERLNNAQMIVNTSAVEDDFGANMPFTFNYLDSPATTSATTYKIQGALASAVGTLAFQLDSSVATIILMEIGA